MTNDELVEKVARRLCNTAGSNWNAENCNQTDDGSYPEDQREYYRMLARAAIAVVLEEAAKVCERRFMGDNTREDMEARRCAAAINAWPEMEKIYRSEDEKLFSIILPLPQEPRDE